MAFEIVHQFNGGTKEQYEAVAEVVHPAGGLLEGQLHHFAGKTADGWIVIGIHDGPENWEHFRDETLMPGLQQVGDRGLPGPPQETTLRSRSNCTPDHIDLV